MLLLLLLLLILFALLQPQTVTVKKYNETVLNNSLVMRD